MGCFKCPRISVFIHGRSKGRVIASKGIRQGDPILPFPFLLVSEVLGALIDRVLQSGLFEGFLVGKGKVHVSILQFADNTLLFCKYDNTMIDILSFSNCA